MIPEFVRGYFDYRSAWELPERPQQIDWNNIKSIARKAGAVVLFGAGISLVGVGVAVVGSPGFELPRIDLSSPAQQSDPEKYFTAQRQYLPSQQIQTANPGEWKPMR